MAEGRRGPGAGFGGDRGFTLVELLVAVAVFAVVGAIGFGGLQSVLEARARTDAAAARLVAVVQAVDTFERDLAQIRARPVRGAYGEARPALEALGRVDAGMLAFTRGGRANPLGRSRSALERVVYRLEDGALLRAEWPVLDRAPDTRARERRLLGGVTDATVRYLDGDGEWQPSWPPLQADGSTSADRLPRAVELRLELEGWGVIERLVELPRD